jgi:hypothetical protein
LGEKVDGLKVKIIDEVWTEVTREAPEDSEWDRDDTYQHHYIKGFEVVEDGSYYDFQTSLKEVAFDKPYFLVYVNYDTGDSFGRDEGRIEFVDLFESNKLARILIEKLEEDAEIDSLKSTNRVYYKVDSGEKRECSTWAWKGYFEHVNEISFEVVWRKQ